MEKVKKLSILCGVILISTIIKRRRRSIRHRRLWSHEWLMKREVEGFYAVMMKELQEKDEIRYSNFLRMDYETFRTLLQLVDPHISRKNTNMRLAIGSGERLTITLRFLATGESFRSLQYLFRVSEQSIGQIVPETCQALSLALQDIYLQVSPSTTIKLAVYNLSLNWTNY